MDAEKVAFHVNIASFMASLRLLRRAPVAYRPPLGVPKDPLGVPKGVQWWGTNFYLCPECMGIHLAPFTAAETLKTVKNAEIEGKNGF